MDRSAWKVVWGFVALIGCSMMWAGVVSLAIA